jgi:glucose-1-phosphate adenylyltransferase
MSCSRQSLSRSAIAVILGGGRGTRLWPLTKYRAKPAVPLAGKYRLIDIPISNCLNSGLDRVYILTQFMSSSLNSHITGTYQLDPFSSGFVSLEVASQSDENMNWFQGTADAIRRTYKTLRQWGASHIIILPGDTIFRMDLASLLAFHIEKNADISIALHSTERAQAPGFGILTIDEHDRVTQMIEKPKGDAVDPFALPPKIRARWNMDENKPFLASMGIYVFKTEVLESILEDSSQVDFGHHILPTAVHSRPVYGYVFNDFWEDVGTIAAFHSVNLAITQKHPPFKFYHPEMQIYTRLRFLPTTHVGRLEMEESVICEGCSIKDARLYNCNIGIRSMLGRSVTMRETVMMGADYYEDGSIRAGFEPVPSDAPMMGVGDDCVIEKAIIDKNARVGAGCRLVNERALTSYDDPHDRFYVREGVLIIPKHGIIPPGTIF